MPRGRPHAGIGVATRYLPTYRWEVLGDWVYPSLKSPPRNEPCRSGVPTQGHRLHNHWAAFDGNLPVVPPLDGYLGTGAHVLEACSRRTGPGAPTSIYRYLVLSLALQRPRLRETQAQGPKTSRASVLRTQSVIKVPSLSGTRFLVPLHPGARIYRVGTYSATNTSSECAGAFGMTRKPA